MQKNEIKQLQEQLEEKEARITKLISTIETKESLLAKALNTTTAQENNDTQVLRSHHDDTTETNTEIDTKATLVSAFKS